MIGKFRPFLNKLRGDSCGAMLVETAMVTPMLLVLSLGSYDASRMFARESELQTAASEASAIALANPPDTTAELTTLRNIIKSSTGLTDTDVTVVLEYRCGNNAAYVTSNTSCGTQTVSNFVRINITDIYRPTYADFGIGGNINYRVTRYVMIGQT